MFICHSLQEQILEIHYFMLTGICFSYKILNKHLALLASFLSAQNQTHNYSSLWDPHLKKNL